MEQTVSYKDYSKVVKPRKVIHHEEDELQKKIINVLRFYQSKKDFIVFHVPNGGARNEREGKKFKDMGVLAGVADLIFVFKEKVVFIELKKPSGGRQTDDQKIFQDRVSELGYEYYICRSVDEVLKALHFIN